MLTLPYAGLPVSAWESRTRQLIADHPLKGSELYEVVIQSWDDIFRFSIGSRQYRIGVDIFPRPQIMAFFLHELIPLEFARRYPKTWRREERPDEKDLVCISDPRYSVEVKASSNPKRIFGNRSYTQEAASSRKGKSGYYLAVNFQQFAPGREPLLNMVRLGWLDHADWIGQVAASGQQARLDPNAEQYKLIRLPLDG